MAAKKKLTPAEERALEAKRIPLVFAQTYLHDPSDLTKPFVARWMQKPLLENSSVSRLNTVRAQRGSGKTESIVAWLLWYACTQKNRDILVVGPSKMVVQRVFEKIILQIENSEFLKGSVTSRTKTPWQLNFTTGSKIRGLGTGVATKQNAAALRGEHPHVIYVDEADYLIQGDWDTLSPLFFPTDPGSVPPIVWATTTVTGKREHFYKLCEEKATGQVGFPWKDWWFPARHWPGITFEGEHTLDSRGWYVPSEGAIIKCSATNDSWSKEADDAIRGGGEQAWWHEIMAWWGSASYAVWDAKLLDAAMARGATFKYLQGREHPYQCFTGGVDIDESQAQPNFCVVEYLPPPDRKDGVGGSYVVRLREELERPASGKTYLSLKRKVTEVDRNFGPHAIYIDRGYGSLLVDEIIDLGIRSVQGKWFKEGVEITNSRGESEKKPLKHVMIAHATRLFEEGKIVLAPISPKSIEYDVFGNPVESSEPTWDVDFIRALQNYQVVKTRSSGVPEYTSKNEHSIDAFLLALFAAIEAFDNQFEYRYETQVAHIATGQSPILGGAVAPTPSVSVVRRNTDSDGPKCRSMTMEEIHRRLSKPRDSRHYDRALRRDGRFQF